MLSLLTPENVLGSSTDNNMRSQNENGDPLDGKNHQNFGINSIQMEPHEETQVQQQWAEWSEDPTGYGYWASHDPSVSQQIWWLSLQLSGMGLYARGTEVLDGSSWNWIKPQHWPRSMVYPYLGTQMPYYSKIYMNSGAETGSWYSATHYGRGTHVQTAWPISA